MKDTSNESMLAELSSPVEGLQFVQIKEKIIRGEYKIILRSGKSKVWDIFGRIDNGGSFIENAVACKTCSSVFKFNNSTSNLVKHKCFKNLKATLENRPKVEVDHETKQQVVRTCTEWIIKNCRSFKMIEDDGLKKFAELMLSLGAKYGPNVDVHKLLPHPTTISRNIDKVYITIYDSIKSELGEISTSGYGLTSDLWSDSYLKISYLSLTIHFIKNGKINTKLLAFKSMHMEPCSSKYTPAPNK